MASPQKENGYTAIANEIMEALAGIRIPGEARQCLDVILRKTYGYNKKSDGISLSQFCLLTKMSKVLVCRSLLKLRNMNIIISKKANVKYHTYWFNKDFTSWKPLAKKLITTSTVSKKANPSLAKKLNTKDNTTKAIMSIKIDGIKFNNQTYMLDDIYYEEDGVKKRPYRLGSKSMAYLCHVYLETHGIKLAPGGVFDANKISKGLSKLYKDSGLDVDECARRLRVGADYFKAMNCDWTPEAIWRNWEKIAHKQTENRDVSETRILN